jgi:hypothetical protein
MSTTPQLIYTPTEAASVLKPDSLITIQQIPFTTTWVVQVDGAAVAVDGETIFLNETAAAQAAQSLRPTA